MWVRFPPKALGVLASDHMPENFLLKRLLELRRGAKAKAESDKKISDEEFETKKRKLAEVLVKSPLTIDEIHDFIQDASKQTVSRLFDAYINSQQVEFRVLEEEQDNKLQPLDLRRSKSQKKGKARYLLISEVGKGAQGSVNVAYDFLLGRVVAVKNMVAPNKEYFERTQQIEAQYMAKSPVSENTLTIYDFRKVNDSRVPPPQISGAIIMEYMDPRKSFDLSRLGRNKENLPPHELASLATGLANALEIYHKQGIRHLDIKPSNIFNVDGVYKLTDFGIASDVEMFTETVGTPSYMAPERWTTEKITAASDVWSIALTVLYCMKGGNFVVIDPNIKSHSEALMVLERTITGFDFDGKDAPYLLDTLLKYCQQRYPDQYTQRATKLLPVFQKALKVKAKERHQSAQELAGDLQKALS